MGKKVVAVTNIKHDGETIEAGATVDASKFEKDELKALYDNGAVTVEDGPDEEEDKGPDTSAPAEPTLEPEKTDSTTATPTKATATKATSTDKK